MTCSTSFVFNPTYVGPAPCDWSLLLKYPNITATLQDSKHRMEFENLAQKLSESPLPLIAMFYLFIRTEEENNLQEIQKMESIQICIHFLRHEVDMFSISKSVIENLQPTAMPAKVAERWLDCLQVSTCMETDFVDSFIKHVLSPKDRVEPPPSIPLQSMTLDEQGLDGRNTVFASPSSVTSPGSSHNQDDVAQQQDQFETNGHGFRLLAISAPLNGPNEIELWVSSKEKRSLSLDSELPEQVIDGDTRSCGLKELEQKFANGPSYWEKLCVFLAQGLLKPFEKKSLN